MQTMLTRAVPLPIVPGPILREHHVEERHDTRFRACARLLQALHRASKGLAPGKHDTCRGGKRILGSLLTPHDAADGHNFLSDDTAHVARLALAYAEPGALIGQHRLFANMLSSQPLALNLFAPLALDRPLAKRVLQFMLPAAPIAEVLHIGFEHSPGRGDATLTADNTAFDIAIAYARPDGQRAFIGIELKYSEGMAEPAPADIRKYDDLAQAAGLFKNSASALLRFTGLRQLCREHLLAQAIVMRGDYAQADFLLIAPAHNTTVACAAGLYRAHLCDPLPGQVPFQFLTLEEVVGFIERAGAADHAALLHDRYLDWSKVDRLVSAFIHKPPQTGAIASRSLTPAGVRQA
jgi:hypothetical protein